MLTRKPSSCFSDNFETYMATVLTRARPGNKSNARSNTHLREIGRRRQRFSPKRTPGGGHPYLTRDGLQKSNAGAQYEDTKSTICSETKRTLNNTTQHDPDRRRNYVHPEGTRHFADASHRNRKLAGGLGGVISLPLFSQREKHHRTRQQEHQ